MHYNCGAQLELEVSPGNSALMIAENRIEDLVVVAEEAYFMWRFVYNGHPDAEAVISVKHAFSYLDIVNIVTVPSVRGTTNRILKRIR